MSLMMERSNSVSIQTAMSFGMFSLNKVKVAVTEIRRLKNHTINILHSSIMKIFAKIRK